MVDHIADRMWFEDKREEVEEVIRLVEEEERDNKIVSDIIYRIKELMKEVDQQIMIGNPINGDKKEVERLLNTLL